ncbi:4-carboxymuconolactone decarboxylase family protein [Aspergillus costaricaensis CBS 115574]|uniref:4-carboxymuconolactone decarboxylase family protein n=1 Tax=Aspergillus costaricaensis CBS 115574 TaxID=1448317 RepID=A0ACD1I986_9EURO|nr:4-carboxymuconolactone decarboxylase family protein [Aspergillus costaricaensis CBS 115574]RAK87148.1 4-carboxymuconolactone decarboxylase family protein [Aspergillus costaricaensis CBS 115574]
MTKKSELNHFHETLFEEGKNLRRTVVRDTYVDRALTEGSSDFSRPGQELVTEWCCGHIWTRPELELKQRNLLNLGMLIALNHTRGAIINGFTEKDIGEAVLQATFYCGGPSGIEATKVTERPIDEMIANGEYRRQ